MELDAAINAANVIVMAGWFDSIKELFYQYDANLHEKIIVDPSNPIAPDGKGGFVKNNRRKKFHWRDTFSLIT
ncbi:hypothetical protein BH10BAC2_BH10BAC2_41410 [soil metagenome]